MKSGAGQLLRMLGGVVLAIGVAGAAPSFPLQDGERMTYRVAWAILPGAGEIKIAARQEVVAGKPQLVVTTTTNTRGFARMLLRSDAEASSIYDLATGNLLSLYERSDHRGKIGEHRVSFDYTKRLAAYARKSPTSLEQLLPIPTGDPTDLIMGLLQTRTWDLKEGEKRDALVLFDDDFYELTIHAARHEDVTTSLGTFRTTVLEPRMDKTAPKGMFRRGSSVRVWIAQDSHHLPVKFEVEFKIGTGTATLESYGAPSAAKAPETAIVPAKPNAKNPGP